jgi:hypothetical protein
MHAHPELDELIHERYHWLKDGDDALQSCKVTLEPHRGRYAVHIHLGLPGAHLDVRQDDHGLKDHATLEEATRDAFQKARRALRERASRARRRERHLA